MQADEVEARLARHDAAVVARLTVLVEDRQVDPREARVEPGAPHDVRDIEDAAVVEQRASVADADDARHALHAGRCQVASA